jgi:hypothetical protein
MVTRSEVATGALAKTALVDRRNYSVEGRNHDGEQMRQQEEPSKREEKKAVKEEHAVGVGK